MVSHSLVVRSYWSVVKGISWKHASDSWRYIWQSSIWGIANMESGCKKRYSKSVCVCACISMWVHVCEWERKRERDVFNVSLQHCLHLSSTLSAVPARREKIRMWTREIEKKHRDITQWRHSTNLLKLNQGNKKRLQKISRRLNKRCLACLQ